MLDIIGDVYGKNVLIVDDFTISGGTLIEMAKACKEHGAKDIYACVSHGVFSCSGGRFLPGGACGWTAPSGASAWPSRTRPLSETTTRSRRPLANAEAVSSRQVSSFASATPATSNADGTTKPAAPAAKLRSNTTRVRAGPAPQPRRPA